MKITFLSFHFDFKSLNALILAMKSLRIILLLNFVVSFSRTVLSFDDFKCDEHLKKFEESIENRELWALQREMLENCIFQVSSNFLFGSF